VALGVVLLGLVLVMAGAGDRVAGLGSAAVPVLDWAKAAAPTNIAVSASLWVSLMSFLLGLTREMC
jgi:hypothetical protein